MKKLMIAAATAVAVSAGVYAKNLSSSKMDAQVYDFTLTVKTTECKGIKFTKTIAKLEGENYSDVKKAQIDVRKPKTTKIVGVIWGCECITIAHPLWRPFGRLDSNGRRHSVGGYLFWNPSSEEALNVRWTRFGWGTLNRINKGDSAEGTWMLRDQDPDEFLSFVGAGQGKVTGDGMYLTPAGNVLGNCRVVLSSMSGNFAGLLLSGSIGSGCKFCGNGCTAWMFCQGCDRGRSPRLLSLGFTAAYGSWKIKYNKSASNKLRTKGHITEAYSFKKAGDTKARMQRVEAWFDRWGLASADQYAADEEALLELLDEEEDHVSDTDVQATVANVFYSEGNLTAESGDDDDESDAAEEIDPDWVLNALLGLDDDDAS